MKLVATLLLVAFSALGTGCVVGYPFELVNRGYHAITATKNGPIHEAANDNDLKKATALLKDNPGLVHARGDDGETPLHIAAYQGRTEIAKLLLDYKADVNAIALGHAYRSRSQLTVFYDETEFSRSQKTALHIAAERGRADIVELLLAHGAKVNLKDAEGKMPLHYAVSWRHVHIVEILLAHGAEVNIKGAEGKTPLLLAAESGSAQVVEMLLAHKADLSLEPSIMVTARGPDVAKLLLERKANVNAGNYWTALHSAISKENPKTKRAMVELLLAYNADVNVKAGGDGDTPLQLAAKNGLTDIVEMLLAKGADVNASSDLGWTPLQYAAANESDAAAPTVALLLAHKADVNTKDKFGQTPLHHVGTAKAAELLLNHGVDIGVRRNNGQTALHEASSRRRGEALVEVLVSHGADIKARDNEGKTPLHEAAMTGNTPAGKVLLAHKANTEARDNAGRTPLHQAASGWEQSPNSTELLLENGADVNARGNNGETPLHLASQNKWHIKIIGALIAHNADVNAKDNNGKTPLWFAAKTGFSEGVTFLQAHGAKQ